LGPDFQFVKIRFEATCSLDVLYVGDLDFDMGLIYLSSSGGSDIKSLMGASVVEKG
jgi:hypothetical protein